MTGYSVTIAAAILAAAAQAPSGQTPQQAFNAAEAAAAKADWVSAVDNYRAALKGMNPTSRSVPIVRARLAVALVANRDAKAARDEAEAAIARFGALGITGNDDLTESYLLVGELARRDLDLTPAVAAYRHAMAVAAGPNGAGQVMKARGGLALATMTSDPAAAARALDEMIADPTFATLPKLRQAELLALRARAELNRGDAKAAAGFINRALDIAGRTSTRVTIAQVEMRGDAALIFAKLGNREKVRQFLAFSGAGHLPDNGWMTHAEADLPICGDDIRPEDMAVVEFAIDDNGRTIGAAPVYATRPGAIGETFARSVRTWRWAPAEVKKLDLFWRSSVRIELRCVTRPPGIKLAESFRDATETWLAEHGVVADLSDPAAKPDPAAATPAQRVLAGLVAVKLAAKGSDTDAAAAELETALTAADAPADVRAYAAFTFANWQAYKSWRPGARAGLNAAITALQARADGARSAAWLRTVQALLSEGTGDLRQARTFLTNVMSLPPAQLSADDPIRTIALLHLSLIDKLTGKQVEADTRLAAAGMTTDQCSLLDVQPVIKNMTISTATFPTEAIRWGFEGTVREAFDINADGSVAQVRTVIAYPPLVFGTATEKAVQGFRYVIPTLGDKTLGCAAYTLNVRYILPR